MAKEDEEVNGENDAGKKGKKKKNAKARAEGDIPLPLIIGGALGAVILIIISVIAGNVVANKLFPPSVESIKVALAEYTAAQHTESNENAAKKLNDVPDIDMSNESELFAAGAEWLTFEGKKITTNVKDGQMLLVDVSIGYKLYHKEELIARGFAKPAGGGGGHGEAASDTEAMEADTTNPLYKKFHNDLKSQINTFFAMYTRTDLEAMRSNNGLADKLKEFVKPTFKKFGLQIGDVSFPQFLFPTI